MQSVLGLHHLMAKIPEETKLMSLVFLPEILKELSWANPVRRQEGIKTIKEVWAKLYAYRISWGKDPEAGKRGLFKFAEPQWVEQALGQLDGLRPGILEQEVFEVYGHMVSELFVRFAATLNKPLWVEKTPDNALMAGFIARCFGNLRLINIVRDGRDVACSLMDEPWGPNDPCEALDWWAKRLTASMDQVSRLPEPTHITIRYEDLILSPELVLRRLITFLGLKWESELLSHKFKRGSLGRFRKDLPAHAQTYALEKYGDILRRLGYVSSS
ncbi:hypothetical protein X474_13480 [Dethiosulfatarculus sandiegensis]|uniref:Sulfotransferase n=1 Tax=Dethiosulfatarculus sandiegensis TaxID=1429043 RepID=A0A0D2JCL3_9BACT|nr:hypothetical protein X474_13480 [Dethiosulfatarculus sandiegensis]